MNLLIEPILLPDDPPSVRLLLTVCKAHGLKKWTLLWRYTAAGEKMGVTICGSSHELSLHRDELMELANESSEPNIFYHPCLLIPAFKHLAERSPFVLLVRSANRLAGIIPLEGRTHFHRVPLFHLRLWEHKHCFLSTPLLRRGEEEYCLEELCRWASHQRPAPLFLNFTQCLGTGHIAEALARFAARACLHLSFGPMLERALVDSAATPEAYFERYPKKLQRNIERRLRNLEELGDVQYALLEREAELGSWVSEFLEMEASGWKGKEGSALALHEGDALFLKEAIRQSFQGGALEFSKLMLKGRTLSMRISFIQHGVRFLFKITYDESMKQYSPGVLLEIEEMRRRFDGKQRLYVDSCADPSNEFMNGLFLERRKIRTFRIGLPSAQSKAAVSLVSAAEKLRESMRRYSGFTSFFSRNGGGAETLRAER